MMKIKVEVKVKIEIKIKVEVKVEIEIAGNSFLTLILILASFLRPCYSLPQATITIPLVKFVCLTDKPSFASLWRAGNLSWVTVMCKSNFINLLI